MIRNLYHGAIVNKVIWTFMDINFELGRKLYFTPIFLCAVKYRILQLYPKKDFCVKFSFLKSWGVLFIPSSLGVQMAQWLRPATLQAVCSNLAHTWFVGFVSVGRWPSTTCYGKMLFVWSKLLINIFTLISAWLILLPIN